MAGKVKVKVVDRGWEKLMQEYEKTKGSHTKIGVQSTDKHHDGESLVTIAAQNEFGTDKIPSRPFMRNSFDKNKANINTIIDTEYNKVLSGYVDIKKSLGRVGAWYQGVVQSEITNLTEPPNAPSTIEKKGSSNPLIDTGRMRASIRHVEVIKVT